MANKKLYLLDAHALCYRSFYAVKDLTNSKGQPTNAVYGFVNILRKILKDFRPDYLAVCFDKEGKTFRQKQYSDYKIQRPPMPDDLRSQMPLIHSVVDGYGLPVMEISGYEADDLMATAVELLKDKGVELVIISDDKDLFQLVDDHVGVYSPRKEMLLKETDVEKVFGVLPKYVADFIGLAGDSSDNIPGVQGVGKVTAQKLIKQFGSLKNIYDALDDIVSKSVREKLATQKEQAFMSRDLALLRTDAPLSNDIEDWRIQDVKIGMLYELFTELEFHRFASELKMHKPLTSPEALAQSRPQELVASITREKQCAFLYDQDNQVFLMTDGKNLAPFTPQELKDAVVKIFDDETIIKISYDWKQQYKMLWKCGLDCNPQNVFDVMLAGHLLNPIRNGHELAVLSWQYLKEMRSDDADGAADAATVFQLYALLKAELEKRDALSLLYDIEMPLARVLARMETVGVRLDLELLRQLSGECAQKIAALQTVIYEISGEEFNINSPKQLSQVLFEKLKLPVVKKTKTGYSTNEEVLHQLSWQHELPQKILDYRQLTKLKSTYIDALPELAVSSGGDRLYTSFNQTVTETGRLSSSNPNLQNIPIRTDLGKQIRRAFIPLQNGHLLLSADYSQIELRILAHLSGDESLIKAFNAEEDIHIFTAAQMFEIDPVDVTEEMRTSAKRVNFGIIYGMSSFGLAKDLHVAFAQAQEFIDCYFARYPRVKEFMDSSVADCRAKGYAMTLMNRRRDIPEIVSKNMTMRQFAERQAINTPVQGTAADLMKLAMVKVYRQMEAAHLKSQMLITVHDEIVFDMVPDEEQNLIKLVRREMENAMKLSVPIKVSIKKGTNWLEMEKIRA